MATRGLEGIYHSPKEGNLIIRGLTVIMASHSSVYFVITVIISRGLRIRTPV